jgi:hypothetical protein
MNREQEKYLNEGKEIGYEDGKRDIVDMLAKFKRVTIENKLYLFKPQDFSQFDKKVSAPEYDYCNWGKDLGELEKKGILFFSDIRSYNY